MHHTGASGTIACADYGQKGVATGNTRGSEHECESTMKRACPCRKRGAASTAGAFLSAAPLQKYVRAGV